MKRFLTAKTFLYVAWIQSLLALLGSLYFSEVMDLPPCVLCWYQRILMYPLALILAIGMLRKDKGLHLYVLPFSILGFAVAVYHNLLYWQILPESVAPCEAGISCTTKFFEWFGFITIPFLSLVALTIITVCMLLFRKLNNK